jgi:protein gp37
MADTAIEWADVVWNPTTGCDKVSRGCDNCYALTMAKRLKAMRQLRYQTDGDPRTSGPGFGLAMHDDVLTLPLRWRRPRRVFVNSMSDLFHPKVTDGFIARVFAAMATTPEHTFQVLTKRAPRMASLVGRGTFGAEGFADMVEEAMAEFSHAGLDVWPLPNVWLGVSVEDQEQADARIPRLLETPAAVRWLSCEPLLGPMDLSKWLGPVDWPSCWEQHSLTLNRVQRMHQPQWIVVGGESGPGARPMHPDWARTLRDQCVEAGVPYFFKQAGAALAREWGCSDRKGHDPAEWPESFPREYPNAA